MIEKNKAQSSDTGNLQKTDRQSLEKSLTVNIEAFKAMFKNDETLVVRELENKSLASAKGCIIYIEGMVDIKLISESFIQPFLQCDLSLGLSQENLLEELKNKVIASNNVIQQTDISSIAASIINGDTLFLLEDCDQALVITSKGWLSREITEPETTKVLRGPREGFTESLLVNLSLIRRKIKSPDLKFRFLELGQRTHTKICISYVEGLALKGILKELLHRLEKIDIDGVLDSGYLQELIKDAPFSPFETVGASERPDVIAAKMLEGRIAIFVDGSPFVLSVPFVLGESIQSNEDYYVNFFFASINRLIRGFTAVVSIAIPAIYLSFVDYHLEMIPTSLLLSIYAARQNIPIPTTISLFLMLFMFDIIREASTRMPSHIGDAISIIGTIVLGQAAVEAKLVSAPVIIVTAVTGIMSLMNMSLIGPTIICRTGLLLGASFFGIYGLLMVYILIYLHLMSLRSFGIPYMLGVTRVKHHDGQDNWIRAPWWSMTLRPKLISSRNMVRQVYSSRKNKENG